MISRKAVCSLLVFAAVLSGCGTNPVTGESELQLVSEEQEIQIGEQQYLYLQQAEGGPFVTFPEVQEYVESVGMKIAAESDRPNLPYEFVVLNNSVPNAWALPGGKIAINRGLLMELDSEAELAAVLAHEIVHSAARHGAQMMEKSILMGVGILGLEGLMKDHKYEDVVVGSAAVGAGLIALKYSRQAELEADRYGIKYMSKAGYNPKAAVILQETFLRLEKDRNPEWMGGLFSSHPPSQERLDANKATAAQYPGGFFGWQEYDEAMAQLFAAQGAYEDLDAGYLALKERRASKALFYAEHGIKIAPREAHLYNLRGKAELMQQDERAALASFSTAIDLNPDYFDFYLQRGLLKMKMGSYASARADLLKSEELLPSAEAEYALGNLCLQDSDRQGAVLHFRRAAKNPSSTGRAAQEQLSRLQAGGVSALRVHARIVASNAVQLIIENSGSRPVRRVHLQMSFFDPFGREVGRHEITVREQLDPFTHLTVRVPISVPLSAREVKVFVIRSEVGMAGESGEGDDVADVFHPGGEED